MDGRRIASLGIRLAAAIASMAGAVGAIVLAPGVQDADLQYEAEGDGMLTIVVNGNRFEAALEDNGATRELIERLEEGPVSYEADDYGGFEKVGDLGFSLPAEDASMDVGPGDVVLYQGRMLCIYYGENSWSFTRIARIEGADGLRDRLGEGPVEVTLMLGASGE